VVISVPVAEAPTVGKRLIGEELAGEFVGLLRVGEHPHINVDMHGAPRIPAGIDSHKIDVAAKISGLVAAQELLANGTLGGHIGVYAASSRPIAGR
jgi:hypothetical protein